MRRKEEMKSKKRRWSRRWKRGRQKQNESRERSTPDNSVGNNPPNQKHPIAQGDVCTRLKSSDSSLITKI